MNITKHEAYVLWTTLMWADEQFRKLPNTESFLHGRAEITSLAKLAEIEYYKLHNEEIKNE